jgi:AcrR family transcriptional regulator
MMGKVAARRAVVRFGRPPKELAGEVEERILGSGKPTIYARFANKRALFTAVVMRDVVSRIEQFKTDMPTGATAKERLVTAGVAMLDWTLSSERMGIMRLAVAEVQRFPDLASTVSQTARKRSTEVAARLLGEIAQSSELGTLPAFAPDHLATTTRFFLDLVIVPILIQALFRKNLELLRAEIGPHVARSVACFLTACRNGGAESRNGLNAGSVL